MVYHAYLDGYNVLPALRKLDGPVFIADENLETYLEEKRKALQSQKVFLEHEITDEIYSVVCDFILSQMPHLEKSDFPGLAMQLQEDLAIHRIADGRDWLAACHICFPSGWLPEEKIGRSFREIHEPVPGFNLDASFQLAKAMVYRGPFLRYVWSPVACLSINSHPLAACGPSTGTYVKVERQVTWGFPEVGAALFVIRQELIAEPDLVALQRAVEGMTEEEKRYKIRK